MSVQEQSKDEREGEGEKSKDETVTIYYRPYIMKCFDGENLHKMVEKMRAKDEVKKDYSVLLIQLDRNLYSFRRFDQMLKRTE